MFELGDECKIQQFLLFEGKNYSRQTHLVLSSPDYILVWVAVLAFLKWLNNFQQPRGAPPVKKHMMKVCVIHKSTQSLVNSIDLRN